MPDHFVLGAGAPSSAIVDGQLAIAAAGLNEDRSPARRLLSVHGVQAP